MACTFFSIPSFKLFYACRFIITHKYLKVQFWQDMQTGDWNNCSSYRRSSIESTLFRVKPRNLPFATEFPMFSRYYAEFYDKQAVVSAKLVQICSYFWFSNIYFNSTTKNCRNRNIMHVDLLVICLSSPYSTFPAAGTRAMTPLLAFTGTNDVATTTFLTHSHPFN